MRPWLPMLVVPLLATVLGCHPVNTVPEHVSPKSAVQYYDLEVPPDLEIKAVDFSATTFSEVSGSSGITSSSVGGRAFVKVYGVHRKTGEQFLLLYEDIANRKRPVQVIRFRVTPTVTLPDSSR
jgi:hypothetical protein